MQMEFLNKLIEVFTNKGFSFLGETYVNNTLAA